MDNRRLRNRPGLTAIARAKHTRDFAARPEPDIFTALYGNARTACRERSFASLRHGKLVRRNLFPHSTAVVGPEQDELAIHWIAQHDAVFAIPEGHAIEKAFWILIGVLQLPGLTRIRSFVNSRRLPGACAQQVRGRDTERLHIAEIQRLCSRNPPHLPGVPPIQSA